MSIFGDCLHFGLYFTFSEYTRDWVSVDKCGQHVLGMTLTCGQHVLALWLVWCWFVDSMWLVWLWFSLWLVCGAWWLAYISTHILWSNPVVSPLPSFQAFSPIPVASPLPSFHFFFLPSPVLYRGITSQLRGTWRFACKPSADLCRPPSLMWRAAWPGISCVTSCAGCGSELGWWEGWNWGAL